jgi:ubiquinol-cytochrome c reductase cytochrome c subunit
MTDDLDDVAYDADDGELGFAPAVPVSGAAASSTSGRRRGSWQALRATWRRGVASGGVMLIALLAMSGVYGLFAASSSASNDTAGQAQVAAGQQLFDTSCITCHGANLQGVVNRGPALIGVGSAAVYFQVSTGRMPATGQGAEEYRKTSKFTEAQTEAIAAFVQSIGGGPEIPSGNLAAGPDQLAQGAELFRLNCASCHGTTGKGAPLSAGKTAPGLNQSTEKQIEAAMLSGPESMPVFNDNQLTPQEKSAIVAYVHFLQTTKDPGGNGVDRIGPVSEGLVLWVLGVGALMVTILWIGAKA